MRTLHLNTTTAAHITGWIINGIIIAFGIAYIAIGAYMQLTHSGNPLNGFGF
jgi:hypothetical protein